MRSWAACLSMRVILSPCSTTIYVFSTSPTTRNGSARTSASSDSSVHTGSGSGIFSCENNSFASVPRIISGTACSLFLTSSIVSSTSGTFSPSGSGARDSVSSSVRAISFCTAGSSTSGAIFTGCAPAGRSNCTAGAASDLSWSM